MRHAQSFNTMLQVCLAALLFHSPDGVLGFGPSAERGRSSLQECRFGNSEDRHPKELPAEGQNEFQLHKNSMLDILDCAVLLFVSCIT